MDALVFLTFWRPESLVARLATKCPNLQYDLPAAKVTTEKHIPCVMLSTTPATVVDTVLRSAVALSSRYGWTQIHQTVGSLRFKLHVYVKVPPKLRSDLRATMTTTTMCQTRYMWSTGPAAVVGNVLRLVITPSFRYGGTRINQPVGFVSDWMKNAKQFTRRDDNNEMPNPFIVLYDPCCRRG